MKSLSSIIIFEGHLELLELLELPDVSLWSRVRNQKARYNHSFLGLPLTLCAQVEHFQPALPLPPALLSLVPPRDTPVAG